MKSNKFPVFSYLNLPPCPTSEIVEYLNQLPDSSWFYDSYRTAFMLPILTEGGNTSKKGSLIDGKSELEWTEFCHPLLSTYFSEHILSWMVPKGRIMILKTPPGEASAPHIDCWEKDYVSPQPKLRFVLQGNVSSLYFLEEEGETRPKMNQLGVPFVMDGRWPHGMKNDSSQCKYTVCLGTPWRGEGLEKVEFGPNESQIDWNDMSLPSDYRKYFEDLEQRKEKFKN